MKKNHHIKMLTILIAFTSIFILSAKISAADDPKAREIMEKVDNRYDGDDMEAVMKMILIDKYGKKRIRTMKRYALDHGKDEWKLLFFLGPIEIKDTGMLTYDYDKRTDDDQWLYLSALHKIKRIASHDKTSSFMGSDYSYADMTDKEIENYNYRFLGEKKIANDMCSVIESVPKTKKIIDIFGYTKSILFVRNDCYVIIRSINWVKEGKKLKYINTKKIEKINEIWTPIEVLVTTKNGKIKEHETLFIFSDIKYNQGLSEKIFTTRQLEKGL